MYLSKTNNETNTFHPFLMQIKIGSETLFSVVINLSDLFNEVLENFS